MVYPVTASSVYFQAICPALTSIPNKLSFLWERFLHLLSTLARPFRPITDHVFFLNWQTTALVSIGFTIWVLFENRNHSTRNKRQAAEIEELKKDLKAEKAKADHKKCKEELEAQKKRTQIWIDLHHKVNTELSPTKEPATPLAPVDVPPSPSISSQTKQLLHTELESALTSILKPLNVLTFLIMADIGHVPAKETVDAFKEIQTLLDETHQKTSKMKLGTSTLGFVVVSETDPLVEIAANFQLLQTKIVEVSRKAAEAEKAKLRAIHQFIGKSITLIKQKQDLLKRLLSEDPKQ